MAASWPATIPHKPDSDSLKGAPFRAPLSTDMDDGNQRRRRSTSKNIARLDMKIDMSDAQFQLFKVWVRDALVDGTLGFTMPVFTGAAYQDRLCTFVEPYQFAAAGWGRQSVSFQLDVENY